MKSKITATIALFGCFSTIIFSQVGNNKLATHQFTFNEAIDFGSQNSYDIKSVDYDIKKAEKRIWESISEGLPQVEGSVNYQDNIKQAVMQLPSEIFGGDPGTFTEATFGTKQSLSTGIKLEQLIFSGNYWVAIQSSKVYKEITQLNKKKTLIEVKVAIAHAYINVIVAEQNAAIIDKNIRIAQKNLQESSQMYNAGFLELQAIEQLQLSVAELKNAYKQALGFIEIAKNNLKFVMGISFRDKIVLKSAMKELLTQNLIPSLTQKTFDVDNNIDYQISQNNIRSNELLVKLNKSNALPILKANLDYTYLKNSERFPLWEYDFNWNPSLVLGINLNIPIFSSFKRRSQRQQAEIDLEKAQIAKQKTEEEAKLKAKTQKTLYNNAVENYYTAKDNLDLAEKIYKKETTKYFEGVSTSNDLRQSESQFYSSQSNYISAISSLLDAKVELDKALNKYN